MAQLIPQLSVRDVDAYVTFLTRAFGFDVTEYWRDPNDPNHVNIELALDGATVGIGRASHDRKEPQDSSAPHIGLYVIVDDVDTHYERARAAGATITFERADQPWGHRMYGAVDPEGHEWGFAGVLADDAPA
jgi:PhnB protein